jgi:hypothetical protein
VIRTLELAINGKKRIALQYQGTQRIVEPHLVGVNSKMNEALRAFQIGGHTSSGALPAWRMFLLRDIESIEILNESFQMHPQFNPDDKQMSSILFKVL